MSFASITASVIESFIDNLKRSNGSKKALSIKRIKNIVGPMSKIWNSACNDNNWTLRNPFSDISSKYTEIVDKELEGKDNLTAMMEDDDEDTISTRNVFLLSEWQRLLQAVDPHYHPVLELLLMGMIGSELEGLLKRHVKESELRVRCKIVRDRMGKRHLKFKLKNWNRTREIPLTGRLKLLLAQAAAASTSTRILSFENGIKLPAHYFLLNMKDGSPFNYNSFRKTVWDKAIKKIGLDDRVPYAARHTFVQWSLLIGVTKTRLVDLMGHSTKKMVDEVYGKYRQGLVEERGKILDYLGEDFLALEELKIFFPERYRERMAVVAPAPETAKAPESAIAFCQSFGQSQGLYADNYL
jgi:integrase